MKALVYLRTKGLALLGPDLKRLDALRHYAATCGFTVAEVWVVPLSRNDAAVHWVQAGTKLRENRFDAVLSWEPSEDRVVVYTAAGGTVRRVI